MDQNQPLPSVPEHAPDPEPRGMSDKTRIAVGAGLLAAVAAVGIYVNRAYRPAAPVAVAPAAPSGAQVPTATPSPGSALPKLEESDGFLRERLAALSRDPAFAGWLKTEDLASRFAAAVNLIGKGQVPADALSFLAPKRKFAARKTGGKTLIDERSYARYDMVAGAVASLDAAGAARLFLDVKPLLQQAWQALGEKDGDVQDALGRACAELLKTPVPEGAVAVKPSEKGIVYVYADPALESLSPAQKQLLRMGPANQAKIQAKLRELLSALSAAPAR